MTREAFRELVKKGQPLVICLHRIQTVNHVINAVALMGCGIAQSQQRIELLQVLLVLLSLHGLGFINNQNRIRLGNDVNRSAGPELIQLHADTSCILAPGIERLRIDNHGADRIIRCKAINLCQLVRVIMRS